LFFASEFHIKVANNVYTAFEIEIKAMKVIWLYYQAVVVSLDGMKQNYFTGKNGSAFG
jgi:hypothetical protein